MMLMDEVNSSGLLECFTTVEPIERGWSEDKKYCITAFARN